LSGVRVVVGFVVVVVCGGLWNEGNEEAESTKTGTRSSRTGKTPDKKMMMMMMSYVRRKKGRRRRREK
jgi:hypothetical protein